MVRQPKLKLPRGRSYTDIARSNSIRAMILEENAGVTRIIQSLHEEDN